MRNSWPSTACWFSPAGSIEVSVHISPSLEQWFLSCISDAGAGLGADACLEDLTVIVPSYCRQAFLLRQIVYWMQSSVKVILLDGSPEPLPTHLRTSLGAISNVRYLHLPIGIVERLVSAKNMVDTPYTVLLGDDEFHLPSGLRRAVQHLQAHPEDVGCIGQSIKFYISQDRSQVAYGSGYAHFGYAVQADSVLDRFAYAVERYNAATCYAVLRTEVWKDSWATLLKTSCKDVCEVQQALATYGAGKFATVDQIYWLRSYENVSVSDHNHFKILTFQSWWESAAYADERRAVVAAIAAVIQKHARPPATQAESVAYQGLELFDRFYRESYPAPGLFNRARMKGAFVSFLRAVMPLGWYSALKNRIMPVAEPDPIQGADIGTREALAREACAPLFSFEAETNRELQDVESLIVDFYRNI
jgi:glycosyltransferase domain-containing protein